MSKGEKHVEIDVHSPHQHQTPGSPTTYDQIATTPPAAPTLPRLATGQTSATRGSVDTPLSSPHLSPRVPHPHRRVETEEIDWISSGVEHSNNVRRASAQLTAVSTPTSPGGGAGRTQNHHVSGRSSSHFMNVSNTNDKIPIAISKEGPQSNLSSPISSLHQDVEARASIVVSGPVNLHGKDLRNFVTIGSLETLARHSNSIDWSDALSAAGAGIGGTPESDPLSIMDPYFDLTRSKLTKIFSLFHPDEHGMVSYEGFRRGLEAMGIICYDDVQFNEFIEKVDEDQSGGISYDEFQHAVQEIKLAQLFKEDFIKEMTFAREIPTENAPLGAIEYSPDRMRAVYPIKYVEKFIYSKKPSWATVRWINLEGIDPLMIRRLAVRYRLHPLAVEDALDIDRERPKYEVYEEHSSLMLQTIHAVDINKLRMFQRLYRNTMYAKEDMDSEIDKMSKQEVEDKLKDLRHIMHNPEQLSVYIFADVIISIQESPNAMWNIIKSRLDTSYSKTRQHGPTFLVYTLLDACVDDLTPMVHAFGAKLLLLDRLLHLDSRKFDCKKLHHCLKQISGLKRMCKPLNEVVTQLSESNGSEFQGEILRYFRDVHDHILSVEEDCEKHLETCRSLIDSYHNIRSQKQDQVSFTLTLIAAIFLPAQFLTGLYGMNFENMPELKTFGGYYVWWAFVLLTMISTIWYFRHKMWL